MIVSSLAFMRWDRVVFVGERVFLLSMFAMPTNGVHAHASCFFRRC